ncbi:hybrid sensor histidine kinase/response regulator [Pseudomonas sp. Marseille-Q0931]|uniref:hybrid sensor histidine kinase/response regulator n=1 Tax=Pseudomonas sp. Marseille-Q0931 TaxID=2697507 RepID=UPI0023B969EF|nr:PAS domain-containing sensor histidine kinase [Pseudomonas sp. Marseille-Q0931]
MFDNNNSNDSADAGDRYRLLIDSITDYAIYMLSPDGLVSSWNPGAKRFKGYDEAEVLGKHFSVFYQPADVKAGLPQKALQTAAQEGRFEGEGWRLKKDGSRFWCHVVIDPILSSNGSILGFAKITRDLTERKRAETEFLERERQFRLLVQSVTDYAIYMLDASGVITNWNSGAERIKGYTPDEVIGKHYSLFFTEADRERGEPERGLATAAREGRFETQAWRVRKDGRLIWANVVVDPVRDVDGSVIGFAKVTRDITESRETQIALEQAREALFQSQKMEALGQLTGGVAHDFNNLLMVIHGALQLVLKRVSDPKSSSLLENALQAAQRGATLTHRMLAFARRQELRVEPVDLPDLVRSMAGLLQRSLGARISIETQFPLFLTSVMADPNQLEMAVLNLAVNARDAMPSGGLITIAAVEREVCGAGEDLKPGRYVCLSITDTGSGMDSSTLQRAKEPFFTTKGAGKGTGLGLSMVHGLAEQSGGRLHLKSKRGHGTTAELWLPAVDAPVANDPEVDAPPLRGVELKNHSVLVVDDDPLVLLSTTAMLEDLGASVSQANSAEEAVAKLETMVVDLVITDQVMPGMTGAQLAEQLSSSHPRLPVVLASGFADRAAEELAFKLPRLHKPFDQETLARVSLQALSAFTA